MKYYVKHNTTKKRGYRNVNRRKDNPLSENKSLKVSTDTQVNAIITSFKSNYLFYIVLIGCIYLINKSSRKSKNILLSILTILQEIGYAIV